MPLDEIEFECEAAMDKVVEFFKREVRGVRTGRASPALIENMKIEVSAYGSTMELRELASVTAPEGSLLVVKPFDPTTIKDIEKGLRNSELGITPQSDGKVIRLPVPPLSGERRQKLVTQVKKMAETQRVAVRNARRDANKAIEAEKKDSILTEDDADRGKEGIQEFTNKYEKQIDAVLTAKTKEIQED